MRSAARLAPAIFLASWADCLPMLRDPCPALTDWLCRALEDAARGPARGAPPCLLQAAAARQHLEQHGFPAPPWLDLTSGARLPPPLQTTGESPANAPTDGNSGPLARWT